MDFSEQLHIEEREFQDRVMSKLSYFLEILDYQDSETKYRSINIST